jgi:hypothetical protein
MILNPLFKNQLEKISPLICNFSESERKELDYEILIELAINY